MLSSLPTTMVLWHITVLITIEKEREVLKATHQKAVLLVQSSRCHKITDAMLDKAPHFREGRHSLC